MNKNLKEINEIFKYKIDISFPIINDTNANNYIKKLITNIKEDFIKSSKRISNLNYYYTLHIKYKKYEYKNITTYVFNIRELKDNTYPNSFIKSIRINNDGNIISIDNLINENSNILYNLSKISKNVLLSEIKLKDNITLNTILNKTRPLKKNFENFVYTKDGLLILLDYYKTNPYHYSIKKILVPYELISINQGKN